MICVTPDIEPAELSGLAQSKGIANALIAHDPRNRQNISTKNIWQTHLIAPDGSTPRVAGTTHKDMLIAAEAQKPGVFRIPVQGLSDPKVTAAWWMVERGTGKGALKELSAQAKKKGAIAEQAQLVVAAAQKACDDGLAAAGEGFAAYETVERLAARFEGLDAKPLKARLAELGKDPAVKSELKARGIFRTCQALLASAKPNDQAAGRDGMAQLAKKMPDTVYGQRAAGAAASSKE